MNKVHHHINRDSADSIVGLWKNGRGFTGGYEAPGPDFDYDRPPNCMGACLGVCLENGKCPFLGCPVLSSGCSPTEVRH